MLTTDGPRVLEFNARFGDPETQAILPRLAAPLAPLLVAAADGGLGESGVLAADEGAAVSLTLAADGYPAVPRAGDAIGGIEAARAEGAMVFGAGVQRDAEGSLLTAGGRVLSIVGRGADVAAAADVAYAAADRINFAGKRLRRDIGRPAALAVA
jgi:phosphoribosylamine--glycine ligase